MAAQQSELARDRARARNCEKRATVTGDTPEAQRVRALVSSMGPSRMLGQLTARGGVKIISDKAQSHTLFILWQALLVCCSFVRFDYMCMCIVHAATVCSAAVCACRPSSNICSLKSEPRRRSTEALTSPRLSHQSMQSNRSNQFTQSCQSNRLITLSCTGQTSFHAVARFAVWPGVLTPCVYCVHARCGCIVTMAWAGVHVLGGTSESSTHRSVSPSQTARQADSRAP